MLIDTSHRKWIAVTLGAAVIAGLSYVPYTVSAVNGPSGGSASGLAYGIAGTALLVYAALLGARKKVPTWRLGRIETWLKGHVWLGLLSVVLILLHGHFALGGRLTTVMMLLLGAVALSGIVGLVLQQIVPRMMTERLPLETVFEQLDQIVDQLRAEADHLVAVACGEEARERKRSPEPPLEGSDQLKELYHREVRPLLSVSAAHLGSVANVKRRAALFTQWRTLLPTALHVTLDDLEMICEERRQLDLQRRLHRWLHGWLFVHVPLSFALLLLTAAHAAVALRY